MRLQCGQLVFGLLHGVRRLFVLQQGGLTLTFFVVAGVQPLAQAVGVLQGKVKCQRCTEGLPLLQVSSQLLLVLRDELLLALLLFFQAFATGAQFGALSIQSLGCGAHLGQAQCGFRRFYRLILLNGRVAAGAAQRTGFTGLQAGALGFQADDALFQLEGFLHVCLVGFLLFILLPRLFELFFMFAELRLAGGKLLALLLQPLADLAKQGRQGK
ncbi:hypothetical protein D3C78_1071310 [compost metagenome]